MTNRLLTLQDIPIEAQARARACYDVGDPSRCWIWRGPIAQIDGRFATPIFRVDRKWNIPARRMVYLLECGHMPAGNLACECGDPHCVNPHRHVAPTRVSRPAPIRRHVSATAAREEAEHMAQALADFQRYASDDAFSAEDRRLCAELANDVRARLPRGARSV